SHPANLRIIGPTRRTSVQAQKGTGATTAAGPLARWTRTDAPGARGGPPGRSSRGANHARGKTVTTTPGKGCAAQALILGAAVIDKGLTAVLGIGRIPRR